MTLAEAIRLGAMLNPKAIGNFKAVQTTVLGVVGATCAIGAAAEAAGCVDQVQLTRDGKQALTFLQLYGVQLPAEQAAECPTCNYRCESYVDVIFHLNDLESWTRERIADWVESLYSAPTVTTPVAEEVLV